MRVSNEDFGGISMTFASDEQEIPLIIRAQEPTLNLPQWANSNRDKINQLLCTHGAILFRDFDVKSAITFQHFVEGVSGSTLSYTERSSPRDQVEGNIYTSTEQPKEEKIFLHSEQSYNKQFPLKLFFYCAQAAETGGETPIADARDILASIPASVVQEFQQLKYRYSRYFWPMMGMTWQKAFQTDDAIAVEHYCKQNDIEYQWMPDGALKTYQTRATVVSHPDSGDNCWFNHCTFFNVSTLAPQTQEILLGSFAEEELPNNTYYGDGGKISDEVLDILRSAYEDNKKQFTWQTGDVLMLDNLLMTHGRNPFSGDRKVLVAMSQTGQWQDLEANL